MNQVGKWFHVPAAALDEDARQAAVNRQANLTKPPGALGRLEALAVWLAAAQGKPQPSVDSICITIFVADHGVAVEGISTFPQAVTAEMVKNFARGGAAISVLARQLDANLEVINLGTANDTGPLDGVRQLSLGPGTANFCRVPAMKKAQLTRALDEGRRVAEQVKLSGAGLFIGGEMGIGNTTAATAISCILLDTPPERLVGPGTGLDAEGVKHKLFVIRRALDRHRRHCDNPIQTLRRLGGFEIAALVGSYVACAQNGVPVLVDGFISSVAALAASRLCHGSERWFQFSHTSTEPGHAVVLDALNARPLLDLSMRLGEGSGAAAAVPLLRVACALHNDMATFEEASVSRKL